MSVDVDPADRVLPTVHVTTGRAAAPVAPAPRRAGLPARARIMAWLLLLLTVALLSVVIVTRNLLLADLDAEITAELRQEDQEFRTFAEVGVNPTTGQPFADAGELLTTHLSRQRPGEDEVQVGVFADGTSPQAQGREIYRNAMTADVLAVILAAPRETGETATPEGPVRWSRTLIDRGVVDPRADAVDGYFIVGEFLVPQRSDIDEAVRTLAIVSGIGLLLAGVASWIVSGQILAPLRHVRRTAEEITSDDLTRRIAVGGSDDLSALAEQFNAMLDRVEGAFATQREFVDDAGHELRTPITIVRGHLELMGDDPAERAETVRLCTDELDRMSRIVEDLLVLAKAERPDFVRPGPVELAELTSDIDAHVRRIADRRWVLDTCGDGELLLDAQRVTQAVLQFAQNAVQHTDPGATIRIGSQVRDGMVALWVADTGPGVRPEEAEAIFERFTRGSDGPRRSRSGAGLGLAIVRAIAEAHDGRVRLESVPGAGARFTLEVPYRPAPVAGG